MLNCQFVTLKKLDTVQLRVGIACLALSRIMSFYVSVFGLLTLNRPNLQSPL